MEKKQVLTNKQAFKAIEDAAYGLWYSRLSSQPDIYLNMGGLVAWRKWHLIAKLKYKPGKRNIICLSATIADQVQQSSNSFFTLLNCANAAFPCSKAVFESGERIVKVEANVDCADSVEEIHKQIEHLFGDFKSLVNFDPLWSAMKISGANMQVTPLSSWTSE